MVLDQFKRMSAKLNIMYAIQTPTSQTRPTNQPTSGIDFTDRDDDDDEQPEPEVKAEQTVKVLEYEQGSSASRF